MSCDAAWSEADRRPIASARSTGRHVRPGPVVERLAGGGDGAVGVVGRGVGNLADDLFGRGRDHLDDLGARRSDPLATDVELLEGLHPNSLGNVVENGPQGRPGPYAAATCGPIARACSQPASDCAWPRTPNLGARRSRAPGRGTRPAYAPSSARWSNVRHRLPTGAMRRPAVVVGDDLLRDAVGREDADLRRVEDRERDPRARRARIGDRERAAGEIVGSELLRPGSRGRRRGSRPRGCAGAGRRRRGRPARRDPGSRGRPRCRDARRGARPSVAVVVDASRSAAGTRAARRRRRGRRTAAR